MDSAGPNLAGRVHEFYQARCHRRREAVEWGVGDDSLVGSAFAAGRVEEDEVDRARAFQRELFDAGLAWLAGPAELGGAAMGREERRAVHEIARRYDPPDTSCFHVGQQILSPAIVEFGTPAQKERWLKQLWRGDAIGCQLFSEPNAGSDLPSLRTRAVKVDGGWRINGQKVWSSGAHLAEVGELLARSDDDQALRHKGLTMFLLDMSTPGVTVRPLKQMTGNSHFCEVFLDDVFIPDEDRLGAEGQGWTVALTSLNSERDGFSGMDDHLFLQPLARLVQLAQMTGAGSDPVLRQELARCYTEHRILEMLTGRIEAGPSGALAAAGSSLVKLSSTSSNFDLVQVAARMLGSSAVADSGQWGRFSWSRMLMGVFAPRIAGGTDQIQRNLIAERGLGLPREPR